MYAYLYTLKKFKARVQECILCLKRYSNVKFHIVNACAGLVDVRRPCLVYFPQGLESTICDIHPSHSGYMPMALFAQELVRRAQFFWKKWIKQLQVAWSCLGLYWGKGPADSMLGSLLFHDWICCCLLEPPICPLDFEPTNQLRFFCRVSKTGHGMTTFLWGIMLRYMMNDKLQSAGQQSLVFFKDIWVKHWEFMGYYWTWKYHWKI